MAETRPPLTPPDTYRRRRYWDDQCFVVILSTTAFPPVMHLPGTYRSVFRTRCWRGRAGQDVIALDYRYARLFCRPCQLCERHAGAAP
jgi:hypothetical protein